MHVNKIVGNLNIQKTVPVKARSYVSLNTGSDTFVKSCSYCSDNKPVNKINQLKMFLQEKYISKKYPNFDAENVKEFVEKAEARGFNSVEVLNILKDNSKILSEKYASNIDLIKKDYTNLFQDISSVKEIKVRSKGENSILSKLMTKFSAQKLYSTEVEEAARKIGDGYGARIILKDLSPEKSKSVIEKTLENKMSYEKFVENIQKFNTLGDSEKTIVKNGLDALKETQTNGFVKNLLTHIKKGDIELAADEFNNYGSEISSYFTNNQLKKIAKAYEMKTGTPLTIVNKTDLKGLFKNAEKISLDDIKTKYKENSFFHTNTTKALKQSGYPTAQTNLKTNYTLSGTSLSDMEMQVRGTRVDDFAELEHIAYDIRQGKKTPDRYNDIKTVLRGMSKKSYNKYSKYLSDTYNYHRLNELGLNIPKPKINYSLTWETADKIPAALKNKVPTGQKIDADLIEKITEDGLKALHGV